LLGEGGVGAVFKARDETLQRFVAVKVLHSQFARQPDFRKRFLLEARASASMDHPGIVKVYDFGQAEDLLFIVMEYIPGSNLRELLERMRTEDRWMPLPEAVELAGQVSLAIDYAHEQRVLHRDIKPDNIMLKRGQSGSLPYRPVLTDLGLARLLGEQSITQVGVSMGTPAYMSPEQAMGQSMDKRSDVYSLGILLFELVTGRLPFPATTITEAIRYHTQEPPPQPSDFCKDCPASLEATILKALEKDPADRFQSAESLAKALSHPDTPTDAVIETATLIEFNQQLVQEPLTTEEPASVPITSIQQAEVIKQTEIEQLVKEPQTKAWIEPVELSVEPGDQVQATMTILNQVDMITDFEISVSGIPTEWLIGLPGKIQLPPGGSHQLRLSIQPPRNSQSQARSYPLQFSITNLQAPHQTIEVGCTLAVGGFSQFTSELSPRQVRAGQIAQILIENRGNTQDTFVVSLEDRYQQLGFDPSRIEKTILDGQGATIEFRALSQAPAKLFKRQLHPFIARVNSSTADEQILEGQVVTKARIPVWALILPILACLFIFVMIGVLPIAPGGQTWIAALAARTATPTIPATLTSAPSIPSPSLTSTPVATLTLTPSITPLSSSTPTEPEPTPTEEPDLVMWDLSHGPRQSDTGVSYDLDGMYSQLNNLLEENDITLVPNHDPLEEVDLDRYSMIVIAMPSATGQNYTPAEAEVIAQFIDRGGSLLILAETPDFTNRINEVIAYLDIDVGQSVISESPLILGDHLIFQNVDQVSFFFNGGSLNVRNDQARVIAWQDGLDAIVVIENLPGKVVVIGDSNLFDNRGLYSNQQFALNLFRWLQ
jgi:serine/threonine protein kinase